MTHARHATSDLTAHPLLLESTGEGMFGVDMQGRCLFINRAGAQMLGVRPEEALHRNMHALIHHSHPDGRHYPEAECPIFAAWRGGLPCRIDDEVLWRQDGSSFAAEVASDPIVAHTAEGLVILGAVATFVDISRRKQTELLLKRMNAQRALGDEELERRVAARTAELAGKLAAVRELLAHTEAERDTEQEAQRRDERSRLLARQGLWAALEGQAEQFIARYGLRGEVQCHIATGTASPTHERHGEAGERWALAVLRSFEQMLSNVARHAQAGAVWIRLYVEGPPGGVLHLEVRDDGIGATREALSHPRSYGVLGMRERAGHFGGRITIETAPQQGTVVRLVMPLPEAVGEELGAIAAARAALAVRSMSMAPAVFAATRAAAPARP